MYKDGVLDEVSLPAAQAQYNRSVSEIHTAREQGRVDTYRAVGDLIVHNSPKGKDVDIDAWVAQTPENAKKWALLDWDQQMNMRAKLAEHNSTRGATPEQNQAYAEYIDKIRTGEIDYTNEGGASRFDAAWGHRLPKTAYATEMMYLRQVAGGADKFAKVNEPVVKDVVSQVMGTLGIAAKKPGDRTPGEHAVVIEAFEDAKRGVKVWAKEHPGEPWPRSHVEGGKEMGYQPVVDKYIIRGAAPSKVFGSTDFWPDPLARAQAIATGRAWWYVPTPDEKAKIMSDFKAANGREPTADELKLRYEIAGEKRGAARVAPNSLNIPVVVEPDNTVD
jgi:hypothetical protein